MNITKIHKEKKKSKHDDNTGPPGKKHKSDRSLLEPSHSVPEMSENLLGAEGTEELDSSNVVPKKKHKKHKNKEKEREQNLIQTEQTLQNEDAGDISIQKKKKKKKKKHKQADEEMEHELVEEPQIISEPITPKKKKKKHKSIISELEHNDSITLDMLQSNSSALVSELSELKQSAPSSSTGFKHGESSRTPQKKPNKTKNPASSLLTPGTEEGSDVDRRLQTKKAVKAKKKKQEVRMDKVDIDDPEVQSWLNSVENDDCPDELDFTPCELHALHPNLRWLTPAEKEAAVRNGIKIRQGKWSHKEDTILRHNLEAFVKKYNVPSVTLILGINKQAKQKISPKLQKYLHLKNFYHHLAFNLNERTVYSVYQRARRIFHPMKKTKLTSEDLSQVFRLQTKLGNRWNTISEIMDKPSKVIFEAARYHTEKKEIGDWTPEENEKLLNAVKKRLKLQVDGTCKKLPWRKIAKKVGTRNSNQCRKQWLHNLCWKFSHGEGAKPKWTDEDSLRLVQHLYGCGVETEADLDWNEIFTKFSNVASYSELHYKWYLLKIRVPNYKEKDLEDILLFLERKYQEKVKKL